jgi:hypothetical protein
VFIYYCWLTVLIPDYQDAIITGLVKKGYMVGAAAKDGQAIFAPPDRPPSTLIALSIYHSNPAVEAKADSHAVYRDVFDIMTEMNAKFFSIIVSLSADCAWYGANFSLPNLAVKEPDPVPIPNPKKLDPSMN